MFLWEDPMVNGEREDFHTLSSKDIQGLMIVVPSFYEFTPETFRRGTLLAHRDRRANSSVLSIVWSAQELQPKSREIQLLHQQARAHQMNLECGMKPIRLSLISSQTPFMRCRVIEGVSS
jgi:hypothetical protein